MKPIDKNVIMKKLVLLWAQLTKIYPPLPTSVQPISITKTLLIVPTKNERDPPLFTGKLLIKFQNILRNTTQVTIRHRVKILFSVISECTWWRLFQSFGFECTWWRLFQSFGFERTWWRLFQKHVMHTKIDIYVFMQMFFSVLQNKKSLES